ncbi:membrane bound O-acyl transferase family-domain-containing protein [Phanerochaete sordida]|uniref:Membrane bound O-acyl transferase family-domain-containing protein n=1 Tax=Phanerochaete sordida TaxID=48140 RepID=A0A9P3LFY6_9APHY|nr:membrane bound O-acyl transferase family-domain-containing protein [Phanerochaete sordida]
MVVCDAFQTAIHLLGPDSFGSLRGGTIFDARLPLVPRYLFSSLISLLTATGIYFSITMLYHTATVAGFALAPDPRAWPPLSDAPWAATSLRDFWGRRWHQLFRRLFVQIGARPAQAVFGRAGGVLGGFALSAVLHDVCIWGMGRGTAFPQIGGFFLLNGVAVIAEQAFERATGRKVRGYAGWVWTMLFVLATGNLLVDAWLTRGLAGACAIPDFIRPTWLLAQLWPALRPALL